MKKMVCDVSKETRVVACASYRNWTGDVQSWKDAYFMLLSYKNTWSGCLSMDMDGGRGPNSYPYVCLTLQSDKAKGFVDFMKELGYTVDVMEQTVGVVSPDWDDEDYDDYVIG